MDQMNVQRWANSLRQFHRNNIQNTDDCQLAAASPSTNNNRSRILSHHYFAPTPSEFSTIHTESLSPSSCTPPIVTDVGVGNQNGVRNASTIMKILEVESPNDNHCNDQYSFILDLKPPPVIKTKSQFYTFDMTTRDEENLPYPSYSSFSANQSLTNDFLIPRISKNNKNLSDHHDADALSDAGTYIIDDDNDSEQKLPSPSSSFKRYVNQTKNRHGTFDIHAMLSSAPHTINRPLVDTTIPTRDLPLSSSNSSSSSLHSFPTDNDDSIQEKSSNNFVNTKQRSNTLLKEESPISPRSQIKPPEAFIISLTKSSPNTIMSGPRRKIEVPSKLKSSATITLTKDSNLDTPTAESISPSDQNDTEKYSFRLQQQIPLRNLKSSSQVPIRPQTAIHDQTHSSSFQRNSDIPSNRSLVIINNDSDETALLNSSLTKVYMNKSFTLRKQHSNIVPPTQQAISKPLKSTATNYSTGQTNRAVELRRARAQAKIEELSQRTKKQLHKTEQQNDLMSKSWHSNASLRSNPRTTGRTATAPQRQEMLSTKTKSSSPHHRSSSASSNPVEETTPQYRKAMRSRVTDDQKMKGSNYSSEGERCESLRDNGQRLAIKLIQLSSGILEKLKPNGDVNIRNLEQLVDKLQTVNRTLSCMYNNL